MISAITERDNMTYFSNLFSNVEVRRREERRGEKREREATGYIPRAALQRFTNQIITNFSNIY